MRTCRCRGATLLGAQLRRCRVVGMNVWGLRGVTGSKPELRTQGNYPEATHEPILLHSRSPARPFFTPHLLPARYWTRRPPTYSDPHRLKTRATFPLLNHCSTTAQPLLNHCSTTAQPLLNHCSSTAHPLLIHCSSTAHPLLIHRKRNQGWWRFWRFWRSCWASGWLGRIWRVFWRAAMASAFRPS